MKLASERWIKSGLCWALFTMTYGMYAGLTQQFALSSSHAHGGILGGLWAITFSWLYTRRDSAAAPRHALYQWLIYNVGVAGMVATLYILNTGRPEIAPFIGMSGLLVLASTAWIAFDLWPRRT